jgi:hypothetical protein
VHVAQTIQPLALSSADLIGVLSISAVLGGSRVFIPRLAQSAIFLFEDRRLRSLGGKFSGVDRYTLQVPAGAIKAASLSNHACNILFGGSAKSSAASIDILSSVQMGVIVAQPPKDEIQNTTKTWFDDSLQAVHLRRHIAYIYRRRIPFCRDIASRVSCYDSHFSAPKLACCATGQLHSTVTVCRAADR